ncbi:MAG: beta-lactamase family protein [Oscillospiraceae bacterium]|nr:beta-lactamase family protein [Oscillospiraceae bacterium]
MDFDKLDSFIQDNVSKGFPAGMAVNVIHKGKTVYSSTFGTMDGERPVREDSIYRLFSLTKPITATAVMQLVENGKIELDFPLKWYYTPFSDLMVSKDGKLEKPARDVTILDLLTMRSGFKYPDDTHAGKEMGRIWGEQTERIRNGDPWTTAQFISEMAKAPLSFDPGEKWEYGSSADVLAFVIEQVSDMRFSDYLKKNIFDRLDMYDTDFYVPKEKADRLMTCYRFDENGKNVKHENVNELCITDVFEPPVFESGGAGLFSTIGDYTKFVKMLMGEGNKDGIHILGRNTVSFMRQCIVPSAVTAPACWESMRGQGYGALMRVMEKRTKSGMLYHENTYGWDGLLGCYFSIDPTEELGLVLFMQQLYQGCGDFARRMQNLIWGLL